MSSTIIVQSEEAKDRAATLRNRARLGANKNLLFWYRELYRDQFKDFANPAALSILEIGSGTSPLNNFSQTLLRATCLIWIISTLCLTATKSISCTQSKTTA